MYSEDPINKIEWRDVESLSANAWNPNMVLNPELKLLEISLLSTGWVQPLLITPDGTIIDGFHRWMLSKESQALKERYGGKVPCAILEVSPAEAKMMTVRMNRAKGTHVAVRMSELVKSLIDEHGCSPAEVAREIGATRDEVALLYQDSIFKARNIEHYRYSRAWVPAEEKKARPSIERGAGLKEGVG